MPGGVYVFDTTTGKQKVNLTPENAAKEDFVVTSVGISGTTAIVGANQTAAPVGSKGREVFLFEVTSGEQIPRLTASGAKDGDRFGNSVAISGSIIIVGANGADRTNDNPAGAANLFH